jgi:hypothetical protein
VVVLGLVVVVPRRLVVAWRSLLPRRSVDLAVAGAVVGGTVVPDDMVVGAVVCVVGPSFEARGRPSRRPDGRRVDFRPGVARVRGARLGDTGPVVGPGVVGALAGVVGALAGVVDALAGVVDALAGVVDVVEVVAAGCVVAPGCVVASCVGEGLSVVFGACRAPRERERV